MLLALAIKLSFSNVFGIDLGHKNVRIGKASPGRPVDIMVNGRGQRSSANLVAVASNGTINPARCDWSVGSDAETMYNIPGAQIVEQFVDYLNHPEDFPLTIIHPTQAVGIGLSLYTNQNNLKLDTLLVTIPSDSTPQFRYALNQALKTTKAAQTRIIDQNSAIAADYVIEKWNKRPSKVLFCDIGASRTELSLFKFEKVKDKVITTLVNFSSSRDVSGDVIDDMIARALFPNETLTKDDMAAIRKAKEQLSAGSDARISMQNQPPKTLESAFVDELVQPLVRKLQAMLDGFDKPHEIELIGGASRFIPFVKGIKEAMNDMEPKRVMNSEEAAAIGAAYIGALDAKIATGMAIEFRKPVMHKYTIIAGNSVRCIEKGEKTARATVTFQDLETTKMTITADDKPYFDITLDDTVPSVDITMDMSSNSSNYEILALKASDGSDLRAKVVPSNKLLLAPANSTEVVEGSLRFVKTLHMKREQTHKIESCIMDTIDRIKYDLDLEAVSTSEERSQLFDYMTEVRKNLTKETYSLKQLKNILSSVQKSCKDIINRADERKERPAALRSLQKQIHASEEQIKTMRADTRVKSLADFIDRTKAWKKAAESQDALKTPTILCKDIERRAETLKKKVEDLKKAKQQENSRRRSSEL